MRPFELLKLFKAFKWSLSLFSFAFPVAKTKAIIDSDTFISIFYNAETSKYSFALIKKDKRIFGVDNARNWHIHPFGSPDFHLETSGLSLSDFLDMLASNRDKW